MRNSLDDVDRMVVALKSAMEDVLSPMSAIRFEICVSEVLTNLVKHANTTDRDAPIHVHVTQTDAAITVRIPDPVGATPFDLRAHAPNLDDVDLLAENGRGLGLIVQMADHVTYGPFNDHNSLTLKFNKQTT